VSEEFTELHQRSLTDPDGFWGEAAEAIDWTRRWDSVLSRDADGTPQWFAGGEANTCWNALDRHVKNGRADQLALIYDSPVTGTVRRLTYAELTDQVARFAGALAGFGVVRGDRVLIYMPLVPEAIIAMLACARIGAIHSVVFGGFAARELVSRIRDARPKMLIAASCGIEPTRVVPYKPVIDAALETDGDSVETCIVLQRSELEAELVDGRDHDWNACMADAKPVDCVPVAATDPLYILYTSGTTGQPKGIVRPSGGHLVAMAWSMRYFYDVRPGEVFWAASDIGWVVGHSYITYGPLINGSTAILYEGKPVGTPDAGAFWRVVQDHKVATMFTAPTAIRAIRREDPSGELMKSYNLSSLRALFLAGERCDPPTSRWVESQLERPVVDHWWQTETGWPISGNALGIHKFLIKHGAVTKPIPGWDVHILDAKGKPVKAGDIGAIVCKLPLPPGVATTLWNAPQRYKDTYLSQFDGYYSTGDAGYFDEDGYLNVMTRTDDVINVAGHRLSTGAIEEVIASHADVAECAVVGLDDDLKGQVPLGLMVLKAGVSNPHETVIKSVVAHVRETMGPVVAFKTAAIVSCLPKTRSGKILRGTVAKIANGKDYTLPATIEEPAALDEVKQALAESGIGAFGADG
jgi:propionyl-CoA synthetase